jgi:hypothetical protein
MKNILKSSRQWKKKLEVRSVLTDGKVLLQFALASIIEAIRRNPDKYNGLLLNNIPFSSFFTQQLPPLHIEDYKDIILNEANSLYDRLLKHFTNSIMDNAVGTSSNSSLSSIFNLGPYNQSDTYTKEDPETYHNSKGDIAD